MLKKLYYRFIYNYYFDRFLNWWAWTFQNPYDLEMPNGQCPVQIEGQLMTGEYYYFRARGSQWSLSIAEKEMDVVMIKERLFNYKEKYGKTFEAGWMLKREAIKFATQAIDKYYTEQITTEPSYFNVRDGL